VIHQHDQMDCGPASLAMIAKHYGQTIPVQHLREVSSMNRQGASVRGITDAAELVGFRTLGAKLTMKQLAEEAPLPCIVYWQKRHFIVVYSVDDTHVYTADPAIGLISYTHEEFRDGWVLEDFGADSPGVAILLEPTDEFGDKKYERKESQRGLKLLWSYLTQYSLEIRQLLYGVVAVGLIQLAFPFLTQSIVDIGIANRDLDFIYVILAAQLMLILSRTTVEFIQSWILLHIGARVQISMVSDFLLKLMRLPLRFFDSKQMGDLIQRIEDHSRVREFLGNTTQQVLSGIFTILTFSAVLAFYSWTIFLIFFVGSGLYVVYISVFMRRRREIDYKRFAEMSENQDLLVESIYGMSEIKLFNAEKQRRWAWERLQAKLYDTSIDTLKLRHQQEGGGVFINEVKNIIITIIGAKYVIDGTLTLGALLAIQYIIGQLNTPINSAVNYFHAAQDASISLDRLTEVHCDVEPEDDVTSIRSIPNEADLRLEGVGFRYAGAKDDDVLSGINLNIPYGKVTAVVGTSGSGKTTLMKLLLKFYDPAEGRIWLGGSNLAHLAAQKWRERCGVVLQDGSLFSDTIARNIALGQERIEETRLRHAVQMAHVQSVVETMPLGLNTVVGRNGVGLSQGQKQRLLIARAIYKDPEYLFFDEATSALDAETEYHVIQSLNRFFEDRTVVVIAHRLSTVKQADQIVVLEGGRIAEIGRHDELLESSGRYFNLVENQLQLDE
jgi:ATP-binding cassette subfamily B protein